MQHRIPTTAPAAHAPRAPRETSTDYAHPRRPAAVRWANRIGTAAERLAGPLPRLAPDRLLAAAEQRAGARLEDLVADAPAFRHRLERLTAAIEAEAHLHPLGRLMVRENLLRILTTRLRFEAHWRAHPELARTPLAPPVVIAGLQRTGTTLLHRLLAQDPQNRWLASWEAVAPVPGGLAPSRTDALREAGARALARAAMRRRTDAGAPGVWPPLRPEDPRMRGALWAETTLRYLAPDFFAVHPVEAEAPEEDCLLFDYALLGTVPEATLGVPSFSAWLETQDKTAAYQFLERMLRALAGATPARSPHAPRTPAWDGHRWVLKTPQHMEDLDALLAVFPEARIVQTHRDPAVALTSFSSMMAHGRAVFSDRVVPQEIADHWRRKTRRMVARTLATRERLGPWREGQTFFDVRYADLVRDPIAVVRRLYAWMGRTLTPEARAAMRAFLAASPRHRYGRHRYRAADFGLDPEAIRREHRAYMARFGIAREEVP